MEQTVKQFDNQAYRLNKLALENQSLKLQEKLRVTEMSYGLPEQYLIMNELKTTIDDILTDLGEETSPEKILSKALSCLNKVEQKRFLMENLIEGVKRGENLGDLTKRYEHLGLMTRNENKDSEGKILAPPAPVTPIINARNSPNTGGFLMGIFTGVLRNVARRLMAIVTVAIRSIPHFVKIVPIVGIAGVFPTLSFSFEADDMSLQDLWELLIDVEKNDMKW